MLVDRCKRMLIALCALLSCPRGFAGLRFLLLLFVFASCCPLANAQLGLNQERISKSQWSRGFHGFNMIMEGNDLERIGLREFRLAEPSDVLLVVIGGLRDLPVNVTNHVDAGGAALVASDSSRSYRNGKFSGFGFRKISRFSTLQDNSFDGLRDCPVVRDLQAHPIFDGVSQIVTNCPGYIISPRDSIRAWLPTVYQRQRRASFVGVEKYRSGGRIIAVGDQSIFTNQMILYGDNVLFANQAVKWLKHEELKKVLILVDGKEYSSLDPADVVVDLPPPSREEVMDALQNLPPSAMLEFANSVATVVEDENMVNEFIHDSVENIPQSAMNRFYLFLMFGIACLTFVAAFIFQRKLQNQTASEVAYRRTHSEHGDLKAIQFRERQQAAHFLLDKFCFDIAGTRFGNWPSFPTGLDVGGGQQAKHIFETMTKASILYRSKPAGYWTRKKLAWLEKEVDRWRLHFEDQPALVDEDEFKNKMRTV